MKPGKDIRIFTIGHSTRTLDELVDLLNEHEIQTLVDVRSMPGSRAYPHFNRENLGHALPLQDIEYTWMPSLGGRRRSPKGFNSPNTGLTSPQFRSYADYMASPEFRQGAQELLDLAARGKTAIMCAEAVYWRCHRRLLSDFLAASGAQVLHIMGRHQLRAHVMTPEAHILPDGTLIYPSPAQVE